MREEGQARREEPALARVGGLPMPVREEPAQTTNVRWRGGVRRANTSMRQRAAHTKRWRRAIASGTNVLDNGHIHTQITKIHIIHMTMRS